MTSVTVDYSLLALLVALVALLVATVQLFFNLPSKAQTIRNALRMFWVAVVFANVTILLTVSPMLAALTLMLAIIVTAVAIQMVIVGRLNIGAYPAPLPPMQSYQSLPPVRIAGTWSSTISCNTLYIQQFGKRVVGIYDLGTDEKRGILLGTVTGKTLNFSWRWLHKRLEGQGVLTLSDDGTMLSGGWWKGEPRLLEVPIRFKLSSTAKPQWLTDADFDEFRSWLNS